MGLPELIAQQEKQLGELVELTKLIDEHITFDDDGLIITAGDCSIEIRADTLFLVQGEYRVDVRQLSKLLILLQFFQEGNQLPGPVKDALMISNE